MTRSTWGDGDPIHRERRFEREFRLEAKAVELTWSPANLEVPVRNLHGTVWLLGVLTEIRVEVYTERSDLGFVHVVVKGIGGSG